MIVFQRIKSGMELIKESIRVFNHYPLLIVPLLITWLIIAPLILLLEYNIDWSIYTTAESLLIVFLVISAFTFLLTFSCSMLLELIQQLETGRRLSLSDALISTLGYNLATAFPLIIVWTIIWFLLTVIQSSIPRKTRGGDNENESFSAESAARTLAGYQGYSVSRGYIESLKKGVRMVVFLILPGIAWENMGSSDATKRGFAILKTHLVEFTTGFVLAEVISITVFLPVLLLFGISDGAKLVLPGYVWIVAQLYIAFAWSYSIYIEQMFAAQLYLWNMRWEREVAKAKVEGRPLPLLEDIAKPTVLDEVLELTARPI
ncbi:MAG TPA: hypothetical protein VE439_02730 [Anaerolineae bacterium]|jgi:hypothetical protein|nr:hypothetical protein [Anaerolineae bacterium]